MGIINKRKSPTPLASKESVRIIDNSHYIAHTEPICKVHRLPKLPDMFSIALWRFYHKLMNNKLPACFSTLKPRLPEIVEHYEIRNPVFHLPAINNNNNNNDLYSLLEKCSYKAHTINDII